MAHTSKLGRGKALKNQTKELLHKLYRYFETEIDRDPNSTVTATQLVTHSTGVSAHAIKRVIAEFKANTGVKKEYKSVKRRNKKNISEDINAQAIRRIIHSFYAKEEEFPVMKDLYLILKAELDYQGSLNTLRRHIAKLGFKYIGRDDNSSLLIEKHDIRFLRVQYLTKIEAYRSQGRDIVYTAEITVESNRISSKQKPDGSITMLKQPAKTKLVIFLAGDQNGIMKNTLLFTHNGTKRDVKEETDTKKENYEQYENWFKFHLIPTLKPDSIVVVDSGSAFHNRSSNPIPHCHSRKKEIIDYLTARNVPHTNDMYKSQLYQLVLLNKDKFVDYKTDSMLREHGFVVLRAPPHHPDLNPVKSVLTTVRNYVGKDFCISVESVMKIAKEKVLSFDSNDWTLACRTAEAEENNLKAIDKIIDEISENACKSEDDESSDSMDEGSDQESMDSD